MVTGIVEGYRCGRYTPFSMYGHFRAVSIMISIVQAFFTELYVSEPAGHKLKGMFVKKNCVRQPNIHFKIKS